MKTYGIPILCVLFLTALWGGLSHPQTVSAQAAPRGGSAGDLRVFDVQGNIKMIVGAGANIVASVGREGVLLVDSGNAASADKVLSTIRQLSPKLPVQYVLNTQYDDNHTGGNEALAKVGRRLVGGEMVIIGHEEVLNRMSVANGTAHARPAQAWPTDTFFAQRKQVYFNDSRCRCSSDPVRRTATASYSSASRTWSSPETFSRRPAIPSSTWPPAGTSTASSKA